jgi:uncharacterized protein (TIGR00106 family)
MIIAEWSLIPIGTTSTSVGRFVKDAVRELEKQRGIRVKPEAMETIIEAENLVELFAAIEKAHNSVFESGVTRVVSEIRIDDRRDKQATMESKTEAVDK